MQGRAESETVGAEWLSRLHSRTNSWSPARFRSLLLLLEGNTKSGTPHADELERALQLTTFESRLIARLLEEGASSPFGGSVADVRGVVKALLALKLKEPDDHDQIEVVCTAPPSIGLKARTTFGAAQEIINAARSTIVLVGYQLTEGGADVVDLLARAASQRRVRVTLVENRLDEMLEGLKRMWPPDAPRPLLYSREADPNDPFSALHAKVLIGDGRNALVTSANLSQHGLHGNIEIGLLVRGEPVARLVSVVDALVSSNEVVEMKW